MESMPIILLFWMVSFNDLGIKEIKEIENYENRIFLDEDDEFTWACMSCDRYGCDGCCDEKEYE